MDYYLSRCSTTMYVTLIQQQFIGMRTRTYAVVPHMENTILGSLTHCFTDCQGEEGHSVYIIVKETQACIHLAGVKRRRMNYI